MQNVTDRNDNLDVTIIIVSYNTRDMTVECIQSVLKQTCSIRYEVIVVDNGSTDGSAEAIRTHFSSIKLISFAGQSRIRTREQSRRNARSGAPDFSCSTRTPSFWIMQSTDCTSLPFRIPNAAFGAVVPCLPTAR